MNLNQPLAVGALTLSLTAVAHGQEVKSLSPGATSPPATLDQMAWLAGRWTGEGFGGKLEEIWSPPVNGEMIGHFFASDEKGVQFIELLQLKQENGSIVYRVKHFNPDFTGWEEKGDYHTFKFVGAAPNRVYFDGLTLERRDLQTAAHYLLIKHKNGATEQVTLTYHRAP
jgi:Domain of unknown function (DUF6265)